MPQDFLSLLNKNASQIGEVLPEIFVAAAFLVGVVLDMVLRPERRKWLGYVGALFLLLALWSCGEDLRNAVTYAVGPNVPGDATKDIVAPLVKTRAFAGMVMNDPFAQLVKALLLGGTLVTLLVAMNAKHLEERHRGEFILLLLAVCLGGMFLSSATNLLMIYLALESMSIVSYALAGYQPRDAKSAEGGIKYAIYGAVASGLMILGMSYLYGICGSLDLSVAAIHYQKLFCGSGGPETLPAGALWIVLALVCSGFLYKVAAVPFHYWSPDAYEGAPTTATAFFSVVPKIAGFAVLVRVLLALCPADLSLAAWLGLQDGAARLTEFRRHLEMPISVLAVATMTLGNLSALGQSNAKRMLAFSSIAHAGYILAALASLNGGAGAAALLFYLMAYLVMNLGAFLALIGIEDCVGGCDLEQLRGAIRRAPVLGTCFVAFLFSLIGLPPLAGFTAKYLVMMNLADAQCWWLVIAIGINSVISLFYYMRLAKAVALDEPRPEDASNVSTPAPIYSLLAGVHFAGLVALFTWFDLPLNLAQQVVDKLR